MDAICTGLRQERTLRFIFMNDVFHRFRAKFLRVRSIRRNVFRASCEAPGVQAEGAEATFDFEESGGLVEYLGWEVGDLHDLIAGADAGGDGLENLSLDIGVTKEVGLF